MSTFLVSPQEYQTKFEARADAWAIALAPQDEYQLFHVCQAVAASMKVENLQANETHRKVILAEIALDSGPLWDIHRKHEAIVLGQTLKRNPERVMHQLRGTPAGRAWLIAEWEHLALAAPELGPSSWSAEFTSLALDLLGVKKQLRHALTELNARFADLALTRVLILSEIARLQDEQVNSQVENATLRASHALGFGLESDPSLKLFRRDEAAAQRRLSQSIKYVTKAQAAAKSKGEASTKQSAKAVPVKVETTVSIGTAEVAAVAPTPLPTEPASSVLKGNRLYRKQRQAKAHHQAYLDRASA